MDNLYESSFERAEGLNSFFVKIFGWMFLGLFITFAIPFGIYNGIVYDNVTAINIALFINKYYLFIILSEVAVVIFLNVRLLKMSKYMAISLFLTYAVLNGLVFSIILPFYQGVTTALGLSALTFLVMAVYGLVTKKDLSGMGSILTVGLISVIIATFVNMFIGSSTLDYIVSYLGLFIFIALTAYDTNKLKNMYYSIGEMENTTLSKIAIIGALQLYLDFVNMFTYILRLLNND